MNSLHRESFLLKEGGLSWRIYIHSLMKGWFLSGFELNLLFAIWYRSIWVVDFIYLFLVTLFVYLWDGFL